MGDNPMFCWLGLNKEILTFLGDIFTSFFGAFLAFLFGIKLYYNQKREENFNYLQYTIASLNHISNSLYIFKKQIILDRAEEALKIKNQILEHSSEKGILDLKIRKMTLFMHNSNFEWPVSQEQLAFLTNREPNLITLLGTAGSSIKTLNSIIYEVNKGIAQGMDGKVEIPSIYYLAENTILLSDQVNSSIYLVEKCVELLIKYSQLEFNGKKSLIKSTELTTDEYKALKPLPIESWENNNWFPTKKPWYRIFSNESD